MIYCRLYHKPLLFLNHSTLPHPLAPTSLPPTILSPPPIPKPFLPHPHFQSSLHSQKVPNFLNFVIWHHNFIYLSLASPCYWMLDEEVQCQLCFPSVIVGSFILPLFLPSSSSRFITWGVGAGYCWHQHFSQWRHKTFLLPQHLHKIIDTSGGGGQDPSGSEPFDSRHTRCCINKREAGFKN